MRAFLTGASGFIGGHVLRALEAEGTEVRCLVRAQSSRRNLAGSRAEVIEGDLTDPTVVRQALDGCDQVFHVAADYRLFARRPDEIYASNVEGTRNVLAASIDAGVERIVYTSTVGTLGPLPGDVAADETSPVTLADMVGHYKKSKYQAKQVARQYAAAGGPIVIVHPSAPVGEADWKPTQTGRIVVDFLRRRLPATVDTGLNLVDVRDVAAGHLLAAAKGRLGEEYILGHRNMTLREILATLADITGLPAPRFELPHWIPLGVAAVDTAISRVLPREPWLPLEAVQLSRHKMYFDPSKAVRELGLPQTPVEEALRRAVDWYRSNGYA
ncbi:MAG: hopanoid-associated sugar epimerase [Thermoanaerobaculia bacterium]